MIFTFWINDDPSAIASVPQSAGAWREQYPDMTVYSDRDAIEILESFGSEYMALYRRIRIPACKSDLARLLLLFRHGGLYIDSHTGPGSPQGLVNLLGKLASKEVVLFDKTWEHKNANDVHIINSVICARRSSQTIKYLIDSALENLRKQEEKEHAAQNYVPYNIFVLTGAWDMRHKLCEVHNGIIGIKKKYSELVDLVPLKQGENNGFALYKFYGYRKEGMHWSERQTREVLFTPRDAPLS